LKTTLGLLDLPPAKPNLGLRKANTYLSCFNCSFNCSFQSENPIDIRGKKEKGKEKEKEKETLTALVLVIELDFIWSVTQKLPQSTL
jgi:hypothetical protein